MNKELLELLVEETMARQETARIHDLGVRAVDLIENLGLEPRKVRKLADRLIAYCVIAWTVGESHYNEILELNVSKEPTGTSLEYSDIGFDKYVDIAKAFSRYGYDVFTNRYSPKDNGSYIVELEIILYVEDDIVAKLVTRVDNYNG